MIASVAACVLTVPADAQHVRLAAEQVLRPHGGGQRRLDPPGKLQQRGPAGPVDGAASGQHNRATGGGDDAHRLVQRGALDPGDGQGRNLPADAGIGDLGPLHVGRHVEGDRTPFADRAPHRAGKIGQRGFRRPHLFEPGAGGKDHRLLVDVLKVLPVLSRRVAAQKDHRRVRPHPLRPMRSRNWSAPAHASPCRTRPHPKPSPPRSPSARRRFRSRRRDSGCLPSGHRHRPDRRWRRPPPPNRAPEPASAKAPRQRRMHRDLHVQMSTLPLPTAALRDRVACRLVSDCRATAQLLRGATGGAPDVCSGSVTAGPGPCEATSVMNFAPQVVRRTSRAA